VSRVRGSKTTAPDAANVGTGQHPCRPATPTDSDTIGDTTTADRDEYEDRPGGRGISSSQNLVTASASAPATRDSKVDHDPDHSEDDHQSNDPTHAHCRHLRVEHPIGLRTASA
jgi:hypothetical protein